MRGFHVCVCVCERERERESRASKLHPTQSVTIFMVISVFLVEIVQLCSFWGLNSSILAIITSIL